MAKVFVGHDWAEAHHDVFVEDRAGAAWAAAACPKGSGCRRFHELVADHVEDPAEVVVATETDRGLFVASLVAAGYTVLAVNPCRFRVIGTGTRPRARSPIPVTQRCSPIWLAPTRTTTGPIAGDSELAEAIKVLTRAHQGLIWTRQRQLNQLRSTLREFYPAALDAFAELGHRDALAVLAVLRPRRGSAAVALQDRRRPASRRPTTPSRGTSRPDPHHAANRAARRPDRVSEAMG